MAMVPGLMDRRPVEDVPGRLLNVYEGDLRPGGMRVRTLVLVQFSLFVLALVAFAGWVLTKPAP